MNTQIWKLPYNPLGYPLQTNMLDTSMNIRGDILKLPHDYFLSKNIVFIKGTKTLFVSSTSLDADILLLDKNQYLSSIAGSDVFGQIKLLSTDSIGIIETRCSYIADSIDPTDFEQPLNRDSDVTHYSIDTNYLTSLDQYSLFSRVDEHLELPNGFINKDTLTFKGEELKVKDITLNQTELKFKDEAKISCTNNYIRYNDATHSWVKYNIGSKQETSLLSFYTTAVPYGGIPITSPIDNTSLHFVDWLTTNPDKHSLVVDRIETKELVTPKFITDKLTIGTHIININDDGDLCFNDNQFRVKKDGTVAIGHIVFTKELLLKLSLL